MRKKRFGFGAVLCTLAWLAVCVITCGCQSSQTGGDVSKSETSAVTQEIVTRAAGPDCDCLVCRSVWMSKSNQSQNTGLVESDEVGAGPELQRLPSVEIAQVSHDVSGADANQAVANQAVANQAVGQPIVKPIAPLSYTDEMAKLNRPMVVSEQ